MASYILEGRTETLKKIYYGGINCALRKVIRSSRSAAPRFDEIMAKTIIHQLETIDNRQWEMIEA